MFQPEHADRVGEGFSGDDGEILVTAHQGAKPAIFELLDAPDLRDDVAISRKCVFGDGCYRLNVIECAIGVKNDGFDRHGMVSLVSASSFNATCL
jgi:hypothetical protein